MSPPYAWTSRSGRSLTIRPIHPADEERLRAFHRSLSDRTVYLRYFGLFAIDRRIAHERLARVCHPDAEKDVVLVAESAGPTAEGRVEAVGRLSLAEPVQGEGEVAVVVADASQGDGLGTELLRRLIEVARDRGVRDVIAYVLPENIRMARLCLHAGMRVAAGGFRLRLSPANRAAPAGVIETKT